MKTHFRFTCLFFALAAMICLVFFSNPVVAQEKNTKLKIGTYDSRIVVFAYSRSIMFRERMQKFGIQSDSAEKAKDSAKIKELSIQAMSFQHLLHLMVFGSGSAGAITDLVKDKLPDVAAKAGVSMILSQFETTYTDPSVEVVDLTKEVCELFKPTENIEKMAEEIRKNAPVPLEDLTIEEDMLNLYCIRFGKK